MKTRKVIFTVLILLLASELYYDFDHEFENKDCLNLDFGNVTLRLEV
ncbi:MAG: hypothetical protein M3R36_12505 [Bacteroidota bacterium]|nr:hypothetical protein [Bacteroidota bacterium]